MTFNIYNDSTDSAQIQRCDENGGRYAVEIILGVVVEIAKKDEFSRGLSHVADHVAVRVGLTGPLLHLEKPDKIRKFIDIITTGSFPNVVVNKALGGGDPGQLDFKNGQCESMMISYAAVKLLIESVTHGCNSRFVEQAFYLLCTFIQLLGEYFSLWFLNASTVASYRDRLDEKKMGKILEWKTFGGDIFWDLNDSKRPPYKVGRCPQGIARMAYRVSPTHMNDLMQNNVVNLPIGEMESHPLNNNSLQNIPNLD